jgi:DNA-binding transcriptional regulator YdaS (Cro superfamily)
MTSATSQDDRRTPEGEAAKRAFDLLGGVTNFAKRLSAISGTDYSIARVSNWAKRGAPAEYCPLIERATNGKVRCEELAPDVAWDVLREQAVSSQDQQ